MTLIDLFFTFPLWAKIITGVILIYLLVEAILMPYHANLRDKRYKDIQKTLNAILEASKTNTDKFNTMQNNVSVLFGLLGLSKKDKNEDTKDG